MRYSEIASELQNIANQMTTLADKLDKAESAVSNIGGINGTLLTNKLTLTVQETCKVLSISSTIMYQLTHRDDFPCIRIGRRTLIPQDKLIEWVNNHCGEEL